MIASGGAGRITDVADVLTAGKADAVAISSLLHYHYLMLERPNGSGLASGPPMASSKGYHSSSRITPCSLPELKRQLVDAGLECRVAPAGAVRE